MKAANAYEMRWDCERNGCFNEMKRVKFSVFAPAFPGKINFTDVDGIVEISGNGLLLEMKEGPFELSTGQRLLYSRMTANAPLAVLLVAGDAREMRLTHYSVIWQGETSIPWTEATTEEVVSHVGEWAAWAARNRARTTKDHE